MQIYIQKTFVNLLGLNIIVKQIMSLMNHYNMVKFNQF